MKKIFSLLLALVLFVNLASAQQDPQATKILNAMSSKYKAMKAFRATFSQTMVSGPKYRLVVSGQEIISDGKLMWTYLKDVNEVTITESDPQAEAMSPSKIFDMYKKGYKYAYTGPEKGQDGVMYDVIEMAPEDRNNPIFKVRLYINQKDKSLKSWKMFRNNGSRYTYSIKNFQPNPTLAADTFSFNKAKYKGVSVVDLR